MSIIRKIRAVGDEFHADGHTHTNTRTHTHTHTHTHAQTGGRTEGRTDIQTDVTKLKATFHNFANAPKKNWNFMNILD